MVSKIVILVQMMDQISTSRNGIAATVAFSELMAHVVLRPVLADGRAG
jgi:hypothetical protein